MRDGRQKMLTNLRIARIATIRGYILLGKLTIEQGKNVLRSNLLVDDPTTFFDDSQFLGNSRDDVIDALWIDPMELKWNTF